MSAARQLSLLDVEPAAPVPAAPPVERDDDAPRISAEELEAFAVWRRAHPPAPSMAHTEHAEWMGFMDARLLAALRAASASGGAPPRDFDDRGGRRASGD